MVENVSEMPLKIYTLWYWEKPPTGKIVTFKHTAELPKRKTGGAIYWKGSHSWYSTGKTLERVLGAWRKPSAPELGTGKSTLCRGRDCKKSHPTIAGTWHRINSTMEESSTGESFALKETGQRRWRQMERRKEKLSLPQCPFSTIYWVPAVIWKILAKHACIITEQAEMSIFGYERK